MPGHPIFNRRSSGVLMHITSLPGRHGSGDLGREAFAFVDFLADAGQSWWQVLPHTPAGNAPGYSPYSSPSSFAGNPWFVSIDSLIDKGWLSRREARPPKTFRDDRVVFEPMVEYRDAMLRRAYAAFRDSPAKSFTSFCEQNAQWLDDWALFCALRVRFGGKIWTRWPEKFRRKDAAAIEGVRAKLGDEIGYHQFVQWLYFDQWKALRKYAAGKGVKFIGDVPIFVGHDSADVWADQSLFALDARGNPRTVSGCPADHFNKKGQVWNHPHYNWKKHQQSGFAWWIRRFETTWKLFDAVRIDHFLGFYRLWSIPFGRKDGIKGQWIHTPGRELFTAMRKKLGELPIIAEDLGTVTKQAIQLRDDFGFPGMRVVMFGFNAGPEHMPFNHSPNCVAYSGTHDCDTAQGYVDTNLKLARKDAWAAGFIRSLRVSAGTDNTETAAHDMIRLTMNGPANTVIFPTQDILNLGSEARMNLPGTEGNNWHWRMQPGALTARHAKMLRDLASVTLRV